MRIQEAIEPLRPLLPRARWTPVESQHVTLKFIGWVEDRKLDAITEVTSAVAAAHPAADMALTGLGAFPSSKRVRVLWAGIDDPKGLGAALAHELSARPRALGVEREDRAFTPHLTLARLRDPRHVTKAPSI